MQIGAMNHPQRDVLDELRWMAEMKLDFVDLTLEPPAAAAWRVDPDAIQRALKELGLGVVGHRDHGCLAGARAQPVNPRHNARTSNDLLVVRNATIFTLPTSLSGVASARRAWAARQFARPLNPRSRSSATT